MASSTPTAIEQERKPLTHTHCPIRHGPSLLAGCLRSSLFLCASACTHKTAFVSQRPRKEEDRPTKPTKRISAKTQQNECIGPIRPQEFNEFLKISMKHPHLKIRFGSCTTKNTKNNGCNCKGDCDISVVISPQAQSPVLLALLQCPATTLHSFTYRHVSRRVGDSLGDRLDRLAADGRAGGAGCI